MNLMMIIFVCVCSIEESLERHEQIMTEFDIFGVNYPFKLLVNDFIEDNVI